MASCRWVLDTAACVSLDADLELSDKKNTLAVKDGGLRAAARSEGLTLLSEPPQKNAKRSCQERQEQLPARKSSSPRGEQPVVFLLKGVF